MLDATFRLPNIIQKTKHNYAILAISYQFHMEKYKIFQICLTEVGARALKTLQIPGCQERCRKTLQFPMNFNYCSENVHLLARKVLISENCEPRTETPHSKNINSSIGFFVDSRELHPNSILEHFQKMLYFQLKTHDSATSFPSLQGKCWEIACY